VDQTKFVINSKSFDDLDFVEVKNKLSKNSFVVIRGLVNKKEIFNAVNKIKNNFKREKDNPTIGETPKDIQKNFQKLLIGGHTHSGIYLTRFYRTFYNPLWEEDIFEMHEIYKKMILIRNICCNLPTNFAIDKIEENGLWSATRIHQYPIGGGYFQKHKDTVLTEVANKNKLNFYQVIINMTKYGIDFNQGGAFIELNGKKILFEKEFELADIIIYDERTIHGVDEIDSNKNLDLDTVNGRITAFVSLYKNL
tara:strand:+ start:2074 stop:2829 length:756 start_codon:yes stop_codon:yes gene_type:complete